MALDAFTISQLAIRSLVPALAVIARHDPDLARQLRRALASAPGNIAEGEGRTGRDRLHHFRVANGSVREAVGHLATAVSFGYVDPPAIAEGLGYLDRVGAMTWRLAGR